MAARFADTKEFTSYAKVGSVFQNVETGAASFLLDA